MSPATWVQPARLTGRQQGLLGGKYVSLVPGGSERMLADGGRITETQGSVSLESLLGRFIFSVTQMNSQNQHQGSEAPAPAPSSAPPAR